MLFLLILGWRLLNAFTTITFFQPDEFFQALEPAHHHVFGYGYITWEWREHLRSAIHPLIYASGYKMAQLLARGDPQVEYRLVLAAPKLIGAVIATVTEYTTYTFAKRYSGSESVARYTLLLSLANPFNWYISTRAFSNTFETMLMVLGLRYWWDRSYTSFGVATSFGVLSCIVRPTNAMFWGYLGVSKLNGVAVTSKVILVGIALFVAGTLMALTFAIDYIFYGVATFPLYNFLEFNVVRNLSMFYGSAPWHFYLVQAVPLMMMMYLPFLLRGAYMMRNTTLVRAAAAVIVGFSMISHKEFRFIYPLQPIMLTICGFAVDEFKKKKKDKGKSSEIEKPKNDNKSDSEKSKIEKSNDKLDSKKSTIEKSNDKLDSKKSKNEKSKNDKLDSRKSKIEKSNDKLDSKKSKNEKSKNDNKVDSRKSKNNKSRHLDSKESKDLGSISSFSFWAIFTVLLFNVGVAIFFTRVNERGVIDILTDFRNEKIGDVLFLTPCHSTPWQSRIHDPNITWTALTCEPPLHLKKATADNVRAYRDESDRFFDDPLGFWEALDPKPSRIVVFEPLSAFAESVHYHECGRYFNSYFHWDSRRAGDLVVYCKH